MRFTTLSDWLAWQTTLHPTEIELGLHRCREVAQRLNLLQPTFPIITVAGTNGKGSSVTMLDAILSAAGYRTGRYLSPHLLQYNERICIENQSVDDAELCEAFAQIDRARQTISLTYFEFGTLAALLILQQQSVDIAILEVGLGGRLDAVNVFDSTVALITAIDIDHVEWLGTDRESIGFEKAGIFRPHRPAVCSDPHPPRSVFNHAQHLQTPLYCLNRDFSYTKVEDSSWSWQCDKRIYQHLPQPSLLGDYQLQNAAGVLMVVELLRQQCSIPETAVCQGLVQAHILGRFQVVPGLVTRIFDVAHNPAGVKVLHAGLQQHSCVGKTHGVVGILQDKDLESMLAIMQDTITVWYVAEVKTPRSAPVERLVTYLQAMNVTAVHSYSSITQAYQQACIKSSPGDRIVVFGSFYTVAEALLVSNIDFGK